MRILHLVALIQASTGGPAVSVTRLASEQAKMGHEVTLACLDYPHLGPQVAAPGVRVVSVKGNFFAVRGRGWCPEFRRVLREEAKNADVVHNHGLWMWPNAYAREAAVAAGKPLIISPRGMLEAWSLNRSKFRKAVAWWLFERKNLQAAVMFHATAEPEAQSIRHTADGIRGKGGSGFSVFRCFGGAVEGGGPDGSGEQKTETLVTETLPYRKPVVVAPNGVDLPDLDRRPGRDLLEEKFPALRDRRWVVFMSRLHPKKGIDVLLRAWRKQQNVEQGAWSREHGEGAEKDVTCDEWRVASWEGKSAQQNVEQGAGSEQQRTTGQQDNRTTRGPVSPWSSGPVLVLAGSDLIGYRKDIDRMVKNLGLEDSVVITGEVSGEAKDCLLANADVFVLPSYSENFGIVVAEALAWGRPVIASTGTPWKEIAEVGAGWWVKPEEEALAHALAQALGTRREALDVMGAKGRALVERRYTWAAPAAKLVSAYEAALSIRQTA